MTDKNTISPWARGSQKFSTGALPPPDPSYQAASRTKQEVANWNPDLGSADADYLDDRDTIVSRVRDLKRNSGHATAAIHKPADMIVGQGLRLSAKVDYRALGFSADQANVLNRQIEAEWRQFADDPLFRADFEMKTNLGLLMRLKQIEWRTAGETTSILHWRPNRGARYATCLEVVDTDRLSNPYNTTDSDMVRGGVEYDADRAPIAYHFKKSHPGDLLGTSGLDFEWVRVPRHTPFGRPIVIHAMEADRAGQTRGVPDLAPVLAKFKQMSSFSEAELASATVNAIFAAFIKSGNNPNDIADSYGVNPAGLTEKERKEFYEDKPISLNGVRIPILPPGEEIVMNSETRQTAAYDTFITTFLREIASAVGISYEQLQMDFSKTNYSSARAALNEVFRWVVIRRGIFCIMVMTPIYLAFLEEAFDRGYLEYPVGAPTLHEMPAAYCRSKWIGPPRGYVDPVKEAQAAQMRIENMTSTLEAEAAEQGHDWEELLDQQAREIAAIEERGLNRANLASMLQVVAPSDTPEQNAP